MGRGEFIFVGLPFILLIAYLIFVPSPTITKIEIQNNLGYIAEGYDFRIIQLTPQGAVNSLSFETFASSVRSFTLDLNLNQAYVITNDGLVNIINIKNPANPFKVAYFDTPGIPRSVAVNGKFAYVADGLEGIQIFSLLNLSNPVRIGVIGELGFVSDIIQIDNLTYVARREQGVDIYDLSNYAEPKLIGHYDTGGVIGQIAIEKVTEDDGRKWIRGTLLVAQRALQIVDFSNPQQPGLLNSYNFPNIPIDNAFVQGKRIFARQENKAVLVSKINDKGKLEPLATITGPRAVLDFAIMENTVFLAEGFQGVQAYSFSDLKDIHAVGKPYSNFWNFKLWITVLSFFFLLIWLAFFAQFVLPVRTFRDRQKIFERLISHLFGRHGPTLFIENGVIKEHSGERLKKGPGVVWLNSASAAVTRTATELKQVIGPGVHFIGKKETIAGTIDLHTQTQSLSPRKLTSLLQKKQKSKAMRNINRSRIAEKWSVP